ncbi:MAG: Fic family protein [Ruminococcus sp.]|nr:Fic family protein [Ruminococcus sp.]
MIDVDVSYNEIVEKWRHSSILTVQDVYTKLHNHRILFAYHSNKIENANTTYHDTREVFENGKVSNYTGDLRTLFEIQNQKICFDYLAEKIPTKKEISTDLIKEVHRLLLNGAYDEHRYNVNQERPGQFKQHDYVTGKNDVGSPPENVEQDLSDLLDDINGVSNEKNYNSLTVAAFFHASFEFIHPFADGNGRVGRTLMNYYLITHDHPPIVIFDEDKKKYYDCLEAFDTKEEIKPLVSFLKEQCVKTWSGGPSSLKLSLKKVLNEDTTVNSDPLDLTGHTSLNR